jgi:hypothetical protein
MIGHGRDDRDSIPGRGEVLYSAASRSAEVHPASYPVLAGALSLGVERLGREANHSPPSSAKVRMVELYLHSPYIIMERRLTI